MSTAEAELLALNELSKEVLWVQQFTKEIHAHEFHTVPTAIQIDNQSAKKLAENHTCSDRSKHIDMRAFYVRDLLEQGKITLQYVPTDRNLADQFTKVLPAPRQISHLPSLGLSFPS
jgi:hypothetical protein